MFNALRTAADLVAGRIKEQARSQESKEKGMVVHPRKLSPTIWTGNERWFGKQSISAARHEPTYVFDNRIPTKKEGTIKTRGKPCYERITCYKRLMSQRSTGERSHWHLSPWAQSLATTTVQGSYPEHIRCFPCARCDPKPCETYSPATTLWKVGISQRGAETFFIQFGPS